MFALMLHRKRALAKYDTYAIRFQVSIAYKRFSVRFACTLSRNNRAYKLGALFHTSKIIPAVKLQRKRQAIRIIDCADGELTAKHTNYVEIYVEITFNKIATVK